MTSSYRRRDLSIDQQLAWTTAASNLQRRFDGAFRAESIERFLRSCDAEVIRAARPVAGPDGLDLAAVHPIRDDIKPASTPGSRKWTSSPMPDTATPAYPSLGRRLLAEFLGTGLLVTVVVGSGIAAQRLSPTDTGLQLLQNSLTTVFGLGVLILWFGPVSGAHFNPVVSAVDWAVGRRTRTGLPGRDVLAYTAAQVLGGIGGAVLANVMFGLAAVQISQHTRSAPGLWLGELVATAGLIAIILTLARTGRAPLSAAAVAAWIGAAYWFTSSTSFANPAVTIARMFSDTFAGIAPASVPMFIVFQILGAALGTALALFLHPDTGTTADAVVVPHNRQATATDPGPHHTARTTVERTAR
jgi:glycerol uptake facilitator-like aquaporin